MAGAEMLNRPVADPMNGGDREESRVKGRPTTEDYHHMLTFIIRV